MIAWLTGDTSVQKTTYSIDVVIFCSPNQRNTFLKFWIGGLPFEILLFGPCIENEVARQME